MIYDKTIYQISESVNKEDFIIVTYYCEAKTADLLLKAGAMAGEQTTGTWVRVPLETDEVRQRHIGRLIGMYEVPNYEFEIPDGVTERKFIFKLAYPTINIGPNIPELLATVCGNITNGGKLKIVDIEFPESYIAEFKGPKFGIEGIRKILGVEKRPLTLGMIKPCTGTTPEQCGQVAYELGLGGLDIIKDDELLGDTSYNTCKARFVEVMKAVKRLKEETGHTMLYAMNITDRPDKMLEKAIWACKNGANCLMMDIQAVGWGAFQMVNEHPDINVPLLAHPAFSGVFYESEYSGVASHLIIGK
ncbi:MAG: 2,3-diketo-5-methylthiopentyl-1-phosphate enolase, partial [Eubacterium sp.]|nr:2,3-diketo-5-methylthiopentyl-1-phosphate enolase [Eubacterium sp.]